MDARRDGESGQRFKSRGAMIMKTVSILLVNSRRVSNQRREKKAAAAAAGKKRKFKMDESAGKVTPKLLESLKKRTHFSKYPTMFSSSFLIPLPNRDSTLCVYSFQKRVDCFVQNLSQTSDQLLQFDQQSQYVTWFECTSADIDG